MQSYSFTIFGGERKTSSKSTQHWTLRIVIFCLLNLILKLVVTSIPAGGGGAFLVYLSDGDVPVSRVSFSPLLYHWVSKDVTMRSI